LKLENKNANFFKQNQIRFVGKLDLKLKLNLKTKVTKRTKQDAQKLFEKNER
jgi:hypothetical protein